MIGSRLLGTSGSEWRSGRDKICGAVVELKNGAVVTGGGGDCDDDVDGKPNV